MCHPLCQSTGTKQRAEPNQTQPTQTRTDHDDPTRTPNGSHYRPETEARHTQEEEAANRKKASERNPASLACPPRYHCLTSCGCISHQRKFTPERCTHTHTPHLHLLGRRFSYASLPSVAGADEVGSLFDEVEHTRTAALVVGIDNLNQR